MKKTPSKQRKSSKPVVQVKDLKAVKNPVGGTDVSTSKQKAATKQADAIRALL